MNLLCQQMQSSIENIYLIIKSDCTIMKSINLINNWKFILAESGLAKLQFLLNNKLAKIF